VLAVRSTRDDCRGVYAGLRPAVSTGAESEESSKLSREHIVAHSVPGLVVVAGGKFTTYRIMAKDAIDEAVGRARRQDQRERDREHRPARRGGLRGRLEQARQDSEGIRRATRCASSTCSTSYGVMTDELLDLIRERPRAARPSAGAGRLHRRRSCLRGHPRGRPAPRGTFWHAAPASRSRPGIVASRPRPSRRLCSATRSAGRRHESTRRSPTIWPRVAAERASQEQPDDASADRVAPHSSRRRDTALTASTDRQH